MNEDKKVLYFDCETTGIKSEENGICQIAFLIEINGQIVEEKNFFVQPFKGQIIKKEALEVNGLTIEQIRNFPLPHVVYSELVEILGRHVDKYNRNDKFYPAGYNVQFDLNFLSEFFQRSGDKYFGSFVNWKRIDPLPILYMFDHIGAISLENYKLETVCKYFEIEIKAHDALSDIKATRKLINVISDVFAGIEFFDKSK